MKRRYGLGNGGGRIPCLGGLGQIRKLGLGVLLGAYPSASFSGWLDSGFSPCSWEHITPANLRFGMVCDSVAARQIDYG